MVRYHLFGSGKTWISEYGSADDPEQFKALFAYSPYHHVKAGTKYPRGPHALGRQRRPRRPDARAQVRRPRCRRRATGGPVLLRIERNAGHGGADLIKAAVEKGADQLAFALWATSAQAPAISSEASRRRAALRMRGAAQGATRVRRKKREARGDASGAREARDARRGRGDGQACGSAPRRLTTRRPCERFTP